MTTLEIILAAACGVFLHAMLQLWRFRHAPGAIPALLLIVAIACYAVAMVHRAPPAPLLYLGFVGISVASALLFIAAVDYLDVRLPHWQRLRWLPAAVSLLLAGINVAGHGRSLLEAIAAEPDLAERARLVSRAWHELPVSPAWAGYAFVVLTVAVALWQIQRSGEQRGARLALAGLPLLPLAVNAAHHLYGFTWFGMSPMPVAVVACLLGGIVALYRADTFDLRPAARAELVDNVVDAMLVVDARGRLVDCNRAAERLIGSERRALLGRTTAGVLPREFHAMLQSPVQLRSDLAVRSGDGATAWFEVDVTPLDLRGRFAGHLLVARSIAERRRVQEDLERDRDELRSVNAQLVEQSVTDPLTSLKNRRYLFQRLNEELNRHHRSGNVLGLLLIDIDHFKLVNDTHGHPVGDEALVLVANALASVVRDCDVVSRIGGEEFAVLAVNTDAKGLIALAERIRQTVREIPVARDTHRPMVLTVSIGVAFAGPDTRSAEGLFAEADRHLYLAKHQGRNRVVAAALPPTASRAG
ncbi:MAG TPA: diguanylate cyclase [Pseudomonadales bacterium]